MEICNSFCLIHMHAPKTPHFCDLVTVMYCTVPKTNAVHNSLYVMGFPKPVHEWNIYITHILRIGQYRSHATVVQEGSTLKSASDVATEYIFALVHASSYYSNSLRRITGSKAKINFLSSYLIEIIQRVCPIAGVSYTFLSTWTSL
jgi:hypothetical protein